MQIKVISNVFQLETGIKKAVFDYLTKHNNKALGLRDDKDNEYFRIGYGENGSISKYGITFNGLTRVDKKLVYTGNIPENAENVKEYVAEIVAVAYANLVKLEEQINTEYASVKAERDELVGIIRDLDDVTGVTNEATNEGEND